MKGKSVTSIFSNLWRKISDDTKEILIDNYGAPVNIIPEMWIENKSKLELFKQGSIDISQHLYLIRHCLE